jgi:hypothetical protein
MTIPSRTKPQQFSIPTNSRTLDTAEALYEEALAMKKRLFPTDHPDVATSLNNLADSTNLRTLG